MTRAHASELNRNGPSIPSDRRQRTPENWTTGQATVGGPFGELRWKAGKRIASPEERLAEGVEDVLAGEVPALADPFADGALVVGQRPHCVVCSLLGAVEVEVRLGEDLVDRVAPEEAAGQEAVGVHTHEHAGERGLRSGEGAGGVREAVRTVDDKRPPTEAEMSEIKRRPNIPGHWPWPVAPIWGSLTSATRRHPNWVC